MRDLDRRPVDAAQAGPAGPPVPVPSNRIDWLFRGALRQGQVHPLMELVQSYREQGHPAASERLS